MPTFQIPTEYASVAPIIVTSPTTRCGTTLTQRLLSTSANSFIYGESNGKQIRALVELFIGVIQYLDKMGDMVDADFERALAGDLTDWRPGLMPPTSVMLDAWCQTFYQMPVMLARHAASVGRPVWGFKYPGYNRDMIKALLQLMPQCKIIYVFRNLFDVLKSAKARQFVKNDDDVKTYCAQWAKNMSDMADLAENERVLFVKYESLVAQREDHVKLLELFTGAQGVRVEAFDIKVNTFQGSEDNGYSPKQYIQPAKLTKTERAILLEQAGAVMEHLYGDMVKAA
jgi:Sulfotransferase family